MPTPDAMVNNLATFVAAAGALGTACFGIGEGLKWTSLGEMGYGRITSYLGTELLGALRIAYGPEYEKLLRAQYRQDSQTQAGIAKTLRQGVRIGLNPENAAGISDFLGTVSAAAGLDLTPTDRAAIGRFELAADARIDSALSSAKDRYLGGIRCTAALLAVAIAQSIAPILGVRWDMALVLGIVAVPFAPIANDLVSAIQAATKALTAR